MALGRSLKHAHQCQHFYVLKNVYTFLLHNISYLFIITVRLFTYTFMQREKERQTHVHVRLCRYLRQKPGKYSACDGPNM